MVFDAAVVGELRALCAGLDETPAERAAGAAALDELTPEAVRHHLLRSLEPAPTDPGAGRALLAELAAEVGVGPAVLVRHGRCR